jgi:hypothetical protein
MRDDVTGFQIDMLRGLLRGLGWLCRWAWRKVRTTLAGREWRKHDYC